VRFFCLIRSNLSILPTDTGEQFFLWRRADIQSAHERSLKMMVVLGPGRREGQRRGGGPPLDRREALRRHELAGAFQAVAAEGAEQLLRALCHEVTPTGTHGASGPQPDWPA